MLSGLVRETFTNQRELRYTAQLGPEMEERTSSGAGISIGVLLGSAKM